MPENISITADLGVNKMALRRLLLAQRQTIPASQRLIRQTQGCQNLMVFLQQNYLGASVALFSPHLGEPDILTLAKQQGYIWALPVVVARAQPLQFSQWSYGATVSGGAYGIAVPAITAWIQPDVLLIPCVGYNLHGYRLGYGGGYYDRTLAALRAQQKNVAAIGVAWRETACQFTSNVFDVRMDKILLF